MKKAGVVVREIDSGWIVNIERKAAVVTLRSYPKGIEAGHSARQFADAVAEVAGLSWCSIDRQVK